MSRLIVTALLLSGCAQRSTPHGQDPAFHDAVSAVQAELEARGLDSQITLPVQFGDVEGESDAECFKGSGGVYINVNRATWGELDPVAQKYVMAHEVGHCVLNRGHTTEVVYVPSVGASRPKSIMYPYAALAAGWSQDFNTEYFDELTGVTLERN